MDQHLKIQHTPHTPLSHVYEQSPSLSPDKGRKFDLRLYVLVTSFQPLKVWLAREGFARLSGERFSLERIDDSRVHLTNMAIQLKTGAAGLVGQPLDDKFILVDEQEQEEEEPEEEEPEEEEAVARVRLGRKWPLSCLREHLTERHGSAVVDELLQNIAG